MMLNSVKLTNILLGVIILILILFLGGLSYINKKVDNLQGVLLNEYEIIK